LECAQAHTPSGMFLSCILRLGTVSSLGEGGVGVFVGWGGKFVGWGGKFIWIGSTNEYSDVFSEGCCSLQNMNDDSDVGEDEMGELLQCDVVVALGVIV
jgi:hypothetical protein